jgi:hypothetical protein
MGAGTSQKYNEDKRKGLKPRIDAGRLNFNSRRWNISSQGNLLLLAYQSLGPRACID